MLRGLNNLERRTAVSTHPGDSITLVTARKLRRITEYLIRRILVAATHRKALSSLKKLRGSRRGQRALVLGNGPSINKLDTEKAQALRVSGLEIIVVNWFPLSKLERELTPDILVLSDPLMTPDKRHDHRVEELWEYIRCHQNLRIAVPTTWSKHLKMVGIETSRVIYFNDLPLEGFGKGTDPTKARHYLSMTAYKAVAIAIYLGYKEIGVLGVDNTMFFGLSVGDDNQLVLADHHFYSKQREDQNMSAFYPNGVADYFYDLSNCFLDLRRYFGASTNVFHLDKESIVDAFIKSDCLGVIKS